VAARSKVWVCGRSLAGLRVRISPGGRECLSLMNALCYQVEVSAMGRTLGVCVCVRACVRACVCVNRCNKNPLHLEWAGRRDQTKKEWKKENVNIYVLKFVKPPSRHRGATQLDAIITGSTLTSFTWHILFTSFANFPHFHFCFPFQTCTTSLLLGFQFLL